MCPYYTTLHYILFTIQLFSNPTQPFLEKCFQYGSVAAYQHFAMLKHHYSVAHALDECLALLEEEDGSLNKPRRRQSQLLASSLQHDHLKSISKLELDDTRTSRQQKIHRRPRGYSLNSSVLPSGESSSSWVNMNKNSMNTNIMNMNMNTNLQMNDSSDATDDSTTTQHDDECESGGFDGVTVEYSHNSTESKKKQNQSKGQIEHM